MLFEALLKNLNYFANMKPDQKATCPSAEPKAGAVLLGVVKQNGEVNLLSQRIEIDEAFIETASQGRDLGPVSYTHLDLYKRQT